jgi:putative ABC transport system substrate-binding protein
VNRRAFVAGLGAVLAAPFGVEALQRQVPLLGYLGYGRQGSDPAGLAGLRDGLRELGCVENQNIFIEYRFAEGKPDRLPNLIRELMNLRVDLLLAQGTSVTAAAKRATATIPIVSVSGDPLGAGFVQSLSRPGGNITGLSFDRRRISVGSGLRSSGQSSRRPRSWASS